MADSLANVGASARKRSLAAVDDWVNQPTDPFEIAALRTLQSVGQRKEGKATQALSSIGDAIYNAAAGPSRLVNAHMAEYQPGMSVQDMPQTMQQLPEVAANVVGTPAFTGGVPGTASMGIRAYKPPPGVDLVRKTPNSIDAMADGKSVGTINISENHPFVSSVFVEPSHQGKGVGRALYSKAERDLGSDLVPSPIGLSDQAKAIWKKELAAMPRDEANKLIQKSREIGRSYGIKDSDIDVRIGNLLPTLGSNFTDKKTSLALLGANNAQQDKIRAYNSQ
jgi:GNAT superfamily N-acetyltransferase